MTWTTVCNASDVPESFGVNALVAGQQVAIFTIAGQWYAISNQDPFTKQFVLSRGIVGSKQGRLKIASPLLKHAFYLDSGEYTEDANVRIPVYAVKVEEGKVQVSTLPTQAGRS